MIPVLLLSSVAIALAVALIAAARRSSLGLLAVWLATEPYASRALAAVYSAMRDAIAPGSAAAQLAGVLTDLASWNHLVFGALALVHLQRVVRGDRPRPQWGALELLMAAFSLLLLANVAFFANNKDHALATAGDAFIIPFAVALITRALVSVREDLLPLLAGASALTLAIAVDGLVERAYAGEVFHRIHGPYMHKGLFGAVLAIAYLCVFSGVYESANPTQKRPVATALRELALHIAPAALFFTFSRGAWLAWLIGLAVTAGGGRSLFQLRRLASIAVVTAAIIGMWSLASRDQTVVPRSYKAPPGERVRVSREFVDDRVTNLRTVQYRLRTWRRLLPTLAEHPLRGLGLGNSADYLLVHRPRKERSARNAHSAYIAILVETGIPAFLCFVAIQLIILRRALDSATAADPQVRWAGLVTLGLTIAYSLPGVPAMTFMRDNSGNLLYYAFVGAMLSLGQPTARRASDS